MLAESLDHEQTLRTIAEQTVSTMADWCAVYLADRRHIRTVAVSRARAGAPHEEWDLDVQFPTDRSPAGVPRVIATGEPELYPEVTDDLLVDTGFDPEQIEIVHRLGIRSALTVPMTARGRTLGAIVLSRTASRPRFDKRDLAVALGLAERAAVAVDNAVLYQHEMEVAQALQRGLLPPALPSVPGIEVAVAYRPAAEEVGGDFYDLWPLTEGVWGFAVGDVCGIGAEAAAFNGVARATLRALSITGADPAEWLEGLNTALLFGAGDEPQGERFCTVVAGTLRVDGRGAILRLATGGHPPPVLRRPQSPPAAIRVTGTLIGAFDDVDISEHELRLEPGDQLVLYTDGVTDVRQPDGTILGERGLLDLLGAADQSAEALVGRLVDRLWSERPPEDDVALLVLAPRPAREAGPTTRPAREAGPTTRPAREADPVRPRPSPDGLESGDVITESTGDLEGEVCAVEVGVGPGLRDATPRVGAAEERSDHRLGADLPPPLAFRAQQVGDDPIVDLDIGVLGVEAHLQGEEGGIVDVVGPDDLRLVVLAGGLSEPNQTLMPCRCQRRRISPRSLTTGPRSASATSSNSESSTVLGLRAGADGGVGRGLGRELGASGQLRHLGDPSRVGQEVAGHGRRVGSPVLIAQMEDLLVDAPVGRPVADHAEHRPRDPALLTGLGDRRRLHVERDHASGAQAADDVRVGDQQVRRPHLPVRRALTEALGPMLGTRRAVDHGLGAHECPDRRGVLDGAGDARPR